MMTGNPTRPAPLDGFAFAAEYAFRSRENGYASLLHCGARFFFFPHQAGHFRRRADELHIAGLADFGEVGVFRKQAVAGMDGIHVGNFGGADHSRNIQIALRKRRRADADGFVGETHVQRIAVGFAVNRNRADAQFLAGANHPQSDFATVRDEDFLEHLAVSRQSSGNSKPATDSHGFRGSKKQLHKNSQNPQRPGLLYPC